MVVDGVNSTTGEVNDIEINAESYYHRIAGQSGVAEEFIHDASYVKLQEVSLAYNLPSNLIGKVFMERAKIAFVGTNLFYFVKHTPDPAPDAAISSEDKLQGVLYSSLPVTRTFGVNLSITF